MSFVVPMPKERLSRLTLFCRAEPLKRPRATVIGKFAKIYQPKDNQRALLDALKKLHPLALEQPVIVNMWINLKRAKTSKMNFPVGRTHGDEDNLRKAVNDGLVAAGHLHDDSLVIGGLTLKAFNDDDIIVIDIWSVHAEPSRYDF